MELAYIPFLAHNCAFKTYDVGADYWTLYVGPALDTILGAQGCTGGWLLI